MIHNPLSRKWMFQTKISNPWTIRYGWMIMVIIFQIPDLKMFSILRLWAKGRGSPAEFFRCFSTSTYPPPLFLHTCSYLCTCECALTYLLSAHTHAPLYDYVHTFLPDCDHRPPVDPGQVSGPGPLGGAPLLTHRGWQVVRNQQSKNNKISREIVVRNQYLTNLWFFPGKLWWCGQTPARNGVCILTGGFPIQFFKG